MADIAAEPVSPATPQGRGGSSIVLRRLRKRAEFLRAARGSKIARRGFVLQAIPRAAPTDVRGAGTAGDGLGAGIGFTVTKKTGNAPERNRIKRRLRAAVAACPDDFDAGHDYVLVGRRACLDEPFEALVSGLKETLFRTHTPRPAQSSRRKERQ